MTHLIDVFQFGGHEQFKDRLMAAVDEVKAGHNLCSDLGECHVCYLLKENPLPPEITEIEKFLLGKLPEGKYRTEIWINTMEVGQTIAPHSHKHLTATSPEERDLWVGVYHVQGGSDLVLGEGEQEFIAAAIPGRLAVFPKDVIHGVPEPATGRRVSICFNCYREDPPEEKGNGLSVN